MAARRKIRLISRLDIKAPNLIKSINLEGVRKIGSPNAFARRYYESGIDEILFMDAVASLYDRNSLDGVLSETANLIFVPMTVGGGLRTLDDVHRMMRAGADKVAINTAAVKNPAILGEVARTYGRQAMVLSIDAKRLGGEARWEAYIDGGREKTGRDVVEWAIEAEQTGAGEILLTSVDREGMTRGYDVELIRAVCGAVSIPVVASGGMGKLEHMLDAVEAGASALAVAHVLHYNIYKVEELKEFLDKNGIGVRRT